jgi:hypothetical protein
MPDAFFVCSIKYRTLCSKQRMNYGDPLWLHPTVGLASSVRELDRFAGIPFTITWQSLVYYGIEGNQGALLSGVH